MNNKSQLTGVGAPRQVRLSKRDSKQIRELIRDGRDEFDLRNEDLARVAAGLELIKGRPVETDIEGTRQGMVYWAARVAEPSQKDVLRLKQRIDDAMTPSKDRNGGGMLRRTAALLVLTILWRPSEFSTSGPAINDAWGRKAGELCSSFDFGPLDEEAEILRPEVPPALIPSRALDEFVEFLDREMEAHRLRRSVRSKATSVIRSALRKSARQMAHQCYAEALAVLERNGIATRKIIASNGSPARILNVILNSLTPIEAR